MKERIKDHILCGSYALNLTVGEVLARCVNSIETQIFFFKQYIGDASPNKFSLTLLLLYLQKHKGLYLKIILKNHLESQKEK